MTNKEILRKCFHSNSRLWNNFLDDKEELLTLFYPSAGEDLRPFLFSKTECLDFIGLNHHNGQYVEPNFFIFSDYFPYGDSRFFDSRILFVDNYTDIRIDDYCELLTTNHYQYNFNGNHVAFKPGVATGRAIFFRAKINSHKVKGTFYRYAIYFFYENVGLIEQLFLKNKMTFSHVVWKRDGSGLGGGRVKLNFIYNVAFKCHTQYFFLWDSYLNLDETLITEQTFKNSEAPEEVQPLLSDKFELELKKKLQIRWDGFDIMNLYFRETIK